MTECEYPLISEIYLMEYSLLSECFYDAIESRRIHLFCLEKCWFQLTESERSSLLEEWEDMATMDCRDHIFYNEDSIVCIFLQMQIFLVFLYL